MILIIPSIELTNGKADKVIIGDPGTENFYKNISANPILLCELFRRENTKTLMIIDKDSFNEENDIDNQTTIFNIIKNLDIPIQLLYNFKNKKEIEFFLDRGVQRVVIGSYAYHNSQEIKELVDNYTSSRIIFYMHTDTHNLKDMKDVDTADPYHYAELIKKAGGQRFMYYDEEWERNGKPDFDFIYSFAKKTGLKITIASGVKSPQTLWEMQNIKKYGIDSVILSEAIYRNNFPCQKIWRIMEAQLEK